MSKSCLGRVEMVNQMIEHIDGGRPVAAQRLGLTECQFKNRLYEMNGTRFFSIDELESLQAFSGTSSVADYFAQRAGAMVSMVPASSDLDIVELHTLSLATSANCGVVDITIQQAINNDGVIDSDEAKAIREAHYKHIAARNAEVESIIKLYKKGG